MLLLFSFNSFSFLFIFLLANCTDFKIKDETDQKNLEFLSLDSRNILLYLNFSKNIRSQRGQSLDHIYSEVWKILSIGCQGILK